MIKFSKIKPVFTSTLVIFILLIISLFQYRWLISWAEQDLGELYRGIYFRVYKSLADELQDEFLIYEELYTLEDLEKVNIKDFFEDNFSTYIIESGFYLKDKRFTYNSQEWSESMVNNYRNNIEDFIVPIKNKGHVVFRFPIGETGDIRGFIAFDLLKFYNEHIEEQVSILDDDYTIAWEFNLPENSHVINSKGFNYSPYRVLISRFLNREDRVFFGVHLFFEVIRDRTEGKIKILNRPKPFNDHEELMNIYFEVLESGKSVVHVKENFITLQWLITLFMLFGLGAAYLLILNQLRKINELRKKEKVFVASITHELRTPLAVIHSAADNIKNGIVNPERMLKYGDLIQDQSKRLSSMVEGILLFSRIEGKAEKPPILRPIDPKSLLKQLDVVKEAAEMEYGCKVKIDFNIKETFSSDQDSIELILSNLIINACKHSGGSQVRVYAHIKLPNQVVFTVEDDGPGIIKKEIRHIFEPFFRGEKSYGEQTKGSGLGLFLSNEKAKMIGGRLFVNSPYEGIDNRKKTGAQFILEISL